MTQNEQAFVDAICAYQYSGVTRAETDALFKSDNSEKTSAKVKEMLQAVKQDEKAVKDMIEKLGTAVNSFGFDPKNIINAVKEDKNGYANLGQLAYEWVAVWEKSKDWQTDGRNEQSTKLCKEIAQAIREHDGENCILDDKTFPKLDDCAYRMHKTLVQLCSGLFHQVLRDTDRTAKRVLDEKYGDKDVQLPFI